MRMNRWILGGLLAATFASGCQLNRKPETTWDRAMSQAESRGRQLFVSQECVRCHDIRGEFAGRDGALVPQRFELSARMVGSSREQWRRSVRDPAHGMSGREWVPVEELTAMMMRSRSLTETELSALIDFLSITSDSESDLLE